ncbi:MAG: hypothetical protein ACR2MO_14405 [Acidimicrobiales bacterium]
MTTLLDAPVGRSTPAAAPGRNLHRLIPAGLFATALAVYVATSARWPTEWDSVNLLFGVDRFDVTEASPHAPGYWLYVAAGRLIRAVTPFSTSASLVAASALAAAATVAMAYVVGRALAGRWLGVAAAGVMLTSPFLAFYGSSIGTYPFDALASLVLIHLAWRAAPGSWHGPAAAAALGLAGGTRQSSVLLLAPVAVVAVARSLRRAPSPVRVAVACAAAGAAGLAIWLVPMALEQPGGLAAVSEEGARIWRQAVSVSSPLYGAPGDGIRYNMGQATGYTLAAVALLLPATAAALFLAHRARSAARAHDDGFPAGRRPSRRRLNPPALLAIAALPPFAFVTILHFGKAGYVLSYLPALVLLLLWPAAALARWPRLAVTGLVVVACAVSALRFAGAPGIVPEALVDNGPWFVASRFGAPYRLTAPTLRETDKDVDRYLALGLSFNPGTDELVYVYLDGGHRFRHAMLSLPQFRMHYLQLGFHEWSAEGRQWRHERDQVLELRPGSHAVFVVDEPREDISALVSSGVARAVQLETGPIVYVVPAGVTVMGVQLVASEPAPTAPR